MGRNSENAPVDGGWGLVHGLASDTAPCSWYPFVFHHPDLVVVDSTGRPRGAAIATPSPAPHVDRDLLSPLGDGCINIPADARSPRFEFREEGVLSDRAMLTVLARPCPARAAGEVESEGGSRGSNALDMQVRMYSCGGSRMDADVVVNPWQAPAADLDFAGCGADDRILAQFGGAEDVGAPDAFTTFEADLSGLAGAGPIQLVLRLRTVPKAQLLSEDECSAPMTEFHGGCASMTSPHALDSFRVTVEA